MDLDEYLGLPMEMYGGAETPKFTVLGINSIAKRTEDVLIKNPYIVLVQELEDPSERPIASLDELKTILSDKQVAYCTGVAVSTLIREFQKLEEDNDIKVLNDNIFQYVFFEGEAGVSTPVSKAQREFIAFIHGLHAVSLFSEAKGSPVFLDSVADKYTWIVNRLNEFIPKGDDDSLDFFGSLTKSEILTQWNTTVSLPVSDDFKEMMKLLMNPAKLLEELKKQSANKEEDEDNGSLDPEVGSVVDKLTENLEGKKDALDAATNETVEEIVGSLDTIKPKAGGFSLPSYPKTAEQFLMDLE